MESRKAGRKAGRPVDRKADGKADRKSNRETKADKKFCRTVNFVGLKIGCGSFWLPDAP